MFSTLLETLQSVAANPGEHVPWLLFITAVIALVSTLLFVGRWRKNRNLARKFDKRMAVLQLVNGNTKINALLLAN